LPASPSAERTSPQPEGFPGIAAPRSREPPSSRSRPELALDLALAARRLDGVAIELTQADNSGSDGPHGAERRRDVLGQDIGVLLDDAIASDACGLVESAGGRLSIAVKA